MRRAPHRSRRSSRSPSGSAPSPLRRRPTAAYSPAPTPRPALLADPREVGPLHGDLHHDNVLDFGSRGWLAIDPNRLLGERDFDFANIFTNPDLADPSRPVATEPGRFARRLAIVAEAARLDRWRCSGSSPWSGLSAAWFIGDGDDPGIDLAVGALAAAELDR